MSEGREEVVTADTEVVFVELPAPPYTAETTLAMVRAHFGSGWQMDEEQDPGRLRLVRADD
ncbi:hypothetical protein GCM10010156_76490 [Planobispora rosea]|uniref:Uncharacterized protein n=1 Tax=Planobispora rosea TaxID=35762 RepID=A0A8J3S8I5_PLARO|nr:hypothetical protein [Planobispora rosea]GGT08112.1 hypothetical protein GCM10010156_76490 [Planobispora rosea]GIH89318.1 hypothetical protein Pro02_77260 [Planobispora rosea]